MSPPICHSTRERKSRVPQYGYDGTTQGSGYHTQIEWNPLQTMYNFNGLPASIYKALLSAHDTLNFDEAMNDSPRHNYFAWQSTSCVVLTASIQHFSQHS
jgi:hypothetical protein